MNFDPQGVTAGMREFPVSIRIESSGAITEKADTLLREVIKRAILEIGKANASGDGRVLNVIPKTAEFVPETQTILAIFANNSSGIASVKVPSITIHLRPGTSGLSYGVVRTGFVSQLLAAPGTFAIMWKNGAKRIVEMVRGAAGKVTETVKNLPETIPATVEKAVERAVQTQAETLGKIGEGIGRGVGSVAEGAISGASRGVSTEVKGGFFFLAVILGGLWILYNPIPLPRGRMRVS